MTDTKLEQAEQNLEQARRALEMSEEELAPRKEEQERLGESWRQNKHNLMEIQKDRRNINDSLSSAKRAIARIREEIEKERQKLESADDGRHAQKLKDIEDSKIQLEELRVEAQDLSSQSAPIDTAFQSAAEDLEKLKQPVQDKVRDAQNCLEFIRELESGTSNWMKGFAPRLPQLLAAIQRETRFREKPVGPIGKHVSLLKPEWSAILEKSFGGALDSFAVTNKSDQNVLSELMDRTG